MASIKKYETARGYAWRVQYRSPDGRSRTKQGFRTKNEAQAWAEKNATDVRAGDWIDPTAGRVRLEELAQAWLSGLVHLKPSSRRVMVIAWEKHTAPSWGRVMVQAVKHSEVQAWVDRLAGGLSASSVRRAHSVLAQVLDVGVKDGLLRSNPARGVRLPRKSPGKVVYLTPAEVGRLADASIHPTIVWVLATVGLRWGELAGLRVGDVDVARRRFNLSVNAVTVGSAIELGTLKNHEARSVAVPGFVMDMVAPHLVGRGLEEWVFPAVGGEPMKLPSPPTGWFQAAAARAGLDVTPHGLRHVAAGLLIQSGANPKMVARQLGHADAAITLNRYTALWEDGLDTVAAVMEESFSDVVGLSWKGG